MSGKEKLQDAEDRLYHEKQVRAMCALHALNNLFQKKHAFSKKDLDQICQRLSPSAFINPHRSMLGLGNYDVNVLMAALQDKGYETIWFDKRKNVAELVPENIMGFILNTPSDYRVGPLRLGFPRKHWIALRHLQGQYMNLDSKLSVPAPIGDESQLLEFLRDELGDGKKELLLVVEKDVFDASMWRRSDEDHEVADRTDNCHSKDSKVTESVEEGNNSEIMHNSSNCVDGEVKENGSKSNVNGNGNIENRNFGEEGKE